MRLVQVCRGGKSDTDGVLVLDDSRTPRRIDAAGPWRLSDELRAAGTVPQLANGQRRCSIHQGWVLDNWATAEFGARAERGAAEPRQRPPGRPSAERALGPRPYVPPIDAVLKRICQMSVSGRRAISKRVEGPSPSTHAMGKVGTRVGTRAGSTGESRAKTHAPK
ncbi:hypothetical protein GCM10010381_66370 [Streptomyces xantholiticus]|nr:hypothetical protein [Streptomyces xantholiticus]GGW72368.1 hypothetical protein GCM10010381_66370 [Streptomyces xantholiticus]